MGTVEKVVGSDMVLFWLDEHIGKANNCIELKQEFESNTTNIYLFHDVDDCERFLPSIRTKKPFCIIQGKHARSIVPLIVQYTTSPIVYIFCFDMTHLKEWAQDYECILNGGIFDHEKDLLSRLTKDLADYAHLKTHEYTIKRAACDEWAQNLTKNAKRLRNDQCTLPYKTDPFNDQDSPCEQPRE